MLGNLHSDELPIYGAKTLGVRDGRLEMHGKHIDDTWALLDETAAQGSNQVSLLSCYDKCIFHVYMYVLTELWTCIQITLSIPVTWMAGDRIVIASTGHRHSQIENEEKEISSIEVTGET